MSMMRTSGMMPMITALQMATASLAVPKSVMKTIVGRAADLFAASSLFARLPQPAGSHANANRSRANPHRKRCECMLTPSANAPPLSHVSEMRCRHPENDAPPNPQKRQKLARIIARGARDANHGRGEKFSARTRGVCGIARKDPGDDCQCL